MPVVQKAKENPFFHSRYADLSTVVQTVTPIIAEHGLSVTQLPDYDGDRDLLTTRLLHESGQWIEASMRLLPIKSDPQAQGSAITYARRYAYCAVLGIVADEDDDGQAASRPAPTTASPAAQRTTRVSSPRSRPSTDSPTTGQPNMRKLFAMLKGIGVTEDGRHEWASAALDRTVDSFTTLSTEDVTLLEKKAKEQQLSKTTYSDEDPERPF